MNNSTFDGGIPVLTEVIKNVPADPAAKAAPEHPPSAKTNPFPEFAAPVIHAVEPKTDAAAIPTSQAAPQQPDAHAAHALSAWTDEEWSRLESDIRERISRQVLGRIDFVLEQRVRDSLSDVLQTTVEGLAAEIKRGLHHTLEDVIARAVAQEISRLQTVKK